MYDVQSEECVCVCVKINEKDGYTHLHTFSAFIPIGKAKGGDC